MKFNGVSMMFRDIELTDEDINSFLKAYIKNETSPNLERMILSADRVLDIDTVLDGLVFSNVEAKDVRISEKHGVRYTNEDGYRIVTKNKEICYISFCIFGGQETFILANWKDEVHKPLRLLDLPYLAMKQVIESMTLMEAFNLSLTSPTLHHFVKHFFKTQKLKLTIQISDCFLVFLKAPNGSFFSFETHEYSEIEKICLRMKFGSFSKVPFCLDEPFCLKTFWDDITKGTTELLTLLLDLFNVEFEKLSVHTEFIHIDYGSVVDWINRLNSPIKEYYFGKGTVNDTHYSQILHNNNLKKCKFSQKPSDDFTLPEFRFTDDHVNWQIWNAQWITLDNLSEIGSVSSLLNHLKFTDQDVNLFFNTLITGKFKNLEFIYLGLNRMDIEPSIVLDGISDLEEEDINRNERVFNRHGYDLPLENTVDVLMATGETCSFQFYRLEDEDGVNSGPVSKCQGAGFPLVSPALPLLFSWFPQYFRNIKKQVQRTQIPKFGYEISQCSKNMKNTVKSSMSNIKFRLELSADKSFIFQLSNEKRRCLAQFRVVAQIPDESTLATELEREVDTVNRQLNELFQFSHRRITVQVDVLHWSLLKRWLNSVHFDACAYKSRGILETDDFELLISNLPNIHTVYLYITPRGPFSTTRLNNLDGKRLFLANAKWIRLENLMTTDFAQINYSNVCLRSKDVNAFLESLMGGRSNKSLRYMKLNFMFPLVECDILKDLLFTEDGDAKVCETSNSDLESARIVTSTYKLFFTRKSLESKAGITGLELFITKNEVLKPMKLLKLPLIVAEQVIRSMNIREAFIVSTCSRRIRAFVKILIKKRHYKCSLKISDAYMFSIDTVPVQDDFPQCFYARDINEKTSNYSIELRIGDHEKVVTYAWDYKYLMTYWKDIHCGATELYRDLMGLFNFTVESVSFFENWRVDVDYEKAIDWVHKNVETKIGTSKYFGHDVEDSDYSKILNTSKSIQCNLYLKPSENYQNIDFKFTEDTPHWKIYEGHWLTLDNFLDMQCVTLVIDHCALTDTELHSLLTNLINGSFPNLEFLSIIVNRNIDMEILLEGIDREVTGAVRVFKRYEQDINIPGGIEFLTNAGQNCTLRIEGGDTRRRMNVFVWK
ncbi:hypothetical protein CAEBREN_19470 [Caenorhabditis brenneri]|uniref:F-box domain-containing protein n=1 Tax=Caenorhabditis brenneri TaxID=135651 RepID=G0N2E6_CAEBE|nr:hypothetical protein CAEBREN_19470 [Caenorhabditis brenneri]